LAETRTGLLLALALLAAIPARAGADLEAASQSYQSTRAYESLAHLTDLISIGTPRARVEELLGDPDYSPVDGQVYYSSNDGGASAPGLIIDYRDANGIETPGVVEMHFGMIRE
jgi:hypothetical protein